MSYYIITNQRPWGNHNYTIVEGLSRVDAVYSYARKTDISDDLDEAIDEAGSINSWGEEVLDTTYDCVEISREEVMGYFGCRLNGDLSIQIWV